MVVDASVWVSRLVPRDLHHAASRDWLAHYMASGGLAIGPMLLLAKVAGAIARVTGDPRLPSLRLAPLDRRLGQAAARLAADLRLRGADAVYVAPAQHLDTPLVTWDGEQLNRTGATITVYTPATAPRSV